MPNATNRILVVTNETAQGAGLHELVRSHALGAATDVFVVAPALNSRIRHLTSDEDGARRAASERLVVCLAELRADGLAARGIVGDADPLQAIADGLAMFDADELIIATHPEGRSNWLEHELVERARASFGLPTTHVVVESDPRGVPLAA